MNRATDDVVYVMQILQQTRQAAVQNPKWYEPDALDRIDKAIYSLKVLQTKTTAA